MYLDSQAEFSSKQDLSQAAGTYVSTNVIDAGADDADAGLGQPNLFVHFSVPEAFVGVGATVDIQVFTDNAEAFGTESQVVATGPLSIAQLNGGIAPLKLPIGLKRYTRLKYVIAGATTTAGQITAGLVNAIQRNHAFPTRIL